MGQLGHFLGERIEYILTAFLIALATVIVVPSWRANKGYFLAAWGFGIVCGLAGQEIGIPPGWDILFTAGAVITAPATILFLQRRTLFEAIELLRNALRERRGSSDDENK